MVYWSEERHTSIPKKPGAHDGGWRFVLRADSGVEHIIHIIRDAAGHGQRLSLSHAREALAAHLDDREPPSEIRQSRDGRFYVSSDN